MNKIDHPEHYSGEHECIEVMRALFGYEAVKDFCRCNSFKYRFRAGRKEGETKQEDIKKAEWYEDYLIKLCMNHNFFGPQFTTVTNPCIKGANDIG